MLTSVTCCFAATRIVVRPKACDPTLPAKNSQSDPSRPVGSSSPFEVEIGKTRVSVVGHLVRWETSVLAGKLRGRHCTRDSMSLEVGFAARIRLVLAEN